MVHDICNKFELYGTDYFAMEYGNPFMGDNFAEIEEYNSEMF